VKDEEIFERLKTVLVESFEVDPGRVTLSAHLFDDLDLDSIDAVDLAIKVQEITGKRVQPQEFKTIRTVADVVTAVRKLLGE